MTWENQLNKSEREYFTEIDVIFFMPFNNLERNGRFEEEEAKNQSEGANAFSSNKNKRTNS